MGYQCFIFWLSYQTFITVLQHFNFGMYIYTNCVYFTLWKAVDLICLWTQFCLCFCIPLLRDYNYLFTFLNLLKKRKLYENQALRFIYERETERFATGDPKETTCCGTEKKRPRPDMKSVNRKRRLAPNVESNDVKLSLPNEIVHLASGFLNGKDGEEEMTEEEKIVENRKEIADSIELIITLLRTITSLALLLGNVQRILHPIPTKYLGPDRPYYESTFYFVFFIFTTLLDALLFLVSCMVTWGCDFLTLWFRVGCQRFVVLLAIWAGTSLAMMVPMLYAMGEMDHSWCQFKNDSHLAVYQPAWHRGL